MDRSTAYKTWQPELSADPHSPLGQSVLVIGPYPVHTASHDVESLALTGDWSSETDVEVFAPKRYDKLTFNGKEVEVKKSRYGSHTFILPPSDISVESITKSLPALRWKVSDDLHERFSGHDDSGPAWVSADKMTTLNPRQPDTLPVLYADEYSFHAQTIL